MGAEWFSAPLESDDGFSMMTDESQSFLARLKADLRAAMRERKSVEVTALRELIAAIDNAQAVPVGDRHDSYVFHAFGDSAVEVPRKVLGKDELRRLVEAEIQSRNNTAKTYRSLGRDDKAQDLSDGAQTLNRYLDPPDLS
ncbi:GatB/YqeY domain-containing protein [Bosea sp. SSUT16]|uniref:GatB/YqeY domain-containing protein n=1 Tax=Bosea spartocytisi TaxID=2773451 RepID=A0A927HY28_9HYPH|nr:GatB/YqeY domain-containing protein [Bosea spartocytisi]MBD3844799.1 GatB/YqeY domain-containing protein [Bosea spartocytisi]MCT4471001.1 GatB/YqeY domain-containing protein [Bosea spartocytisi]